MHHYVHWQLPLHASCDQRQCTTARKTSPWRLWRGNIITLMPPSLLTLLSLSATCNCQATDPAAGGDAPSPSNLNRGTDRAAAVHARSTAGVSSPPAVAIGATCTVAASTSSWHGRYAEHPGELHGPRPLPASSALGSDSRVGRICGSRPS